MSSGGTTGHGSDRTDLAEDRSGLAAERTFAAWLRTGLAALAVGVAFQRLFPEAQPDWVPKTGATVLLALAALMFAFGLERYLKARKRLDRHDMPRFSAVNPVLFATLGAVASVIAAAVVWFL